MDDNIFLIKFIDGEIFELNLEEFNMFKNSNPGNNEKIRKMLKKIQNGCLQI